MIAFEAQKVRRIVGRLERGESVPEALKALLREKGVAAGWLSALGAFEWVELMEYAQETQKYKEPKRIGACEILNLTGNVSLRNGEAFVHLHATVSKETPRGIEVYGGHLVAASVFACEFQVECFEDVVLQRAFDAATGLDLWVGERVALPDDAAAVDDAVDAHPPSSAPPPGPVSWAQVAAVAQAAEAQGLHAPHVEQMPKVGDYLDHRQFGVCRIEGRGTDGAFIVRLANDPRRKKLSVEHFEFLGPRVEGGRRVFTCRRRG